MENPIIGSISFSMHTEGESDMTKPTVAVCKFTNRRQIFEQRYDLMSLRSTLPKCTSDEGHAQTNIFCCFNAVSSYLHEYLGTIIFTGDIDLPRRD